MKISPVGVELFHSGGQTDIHIDMTKLIVAFRNLANAKKIHINFAECMKNIIVPPLHFDYQNKTLHHTLQATVWRAEYLLTYSMEQSPS